jgi:hypothetical protein
MLADYNCTSSVQPAGIIIFPAKRAVQLVDKCLTACVQKSGQNVPIAACQTTGSPLAGHSAGNPRSADLPFRSGPKNPGQSRMCGTP